MAALPHKTLLKCLVDFCLGGSGSVYVCAVLSQYFSDADSFFAGLRFDFLAEDLEKF